MITRFESELTHEHFLKKIKGKKILVACSGPSFELRNWQNLDIDGVITMSFFYNKEELTSRKDIIFAGLSNLSNFASPVLNDFLNSNPDTAVGCEENVHPAYENARFENFVKQYKNRYVNYWTDVHQKILYIGLGGRLIYFALNYSPSELYFIGFDGGTENWKNDPPNSFRPNYKAEFIREKSYKTICANYNKATADMYEVAKQKGVKLQNLGEGLPFNIPSEYSSNHFPLTQDIKNRIID